METELKRLVATTETTRKPEPKTGADKASVPPVALAPCRIVSAGGLAISSLRTRLAGGCHPSMDSFVVSSV